MNTKSVIFSGFLAISALFSAQEKVNKPMEKPNYQAINFKNMDTSTRPQDDFYTYVNGNWIKNTQIPSDKASWGSFNELREKVDSVTLNLLKESLKQVFPAGSENKKVADLYQTITDTVSRNKLGIKPVKPILDKIDAIQNLAELHQFILTENKFGNTTLLNLYVNNHMKKSAENALYLTGPSLGMERDYYQKNDAESKEKLDKYKVFLTRLFTEIGDKTPAQSAQEVLDFEIKIANTLLTNEQIRDSKLQYNPYAIKDLHTLSKYTPLQDLLAQEKITIDSLIIDEINYYKQLDNFINPQNLGVLKKYLKTTTFNDAIAHLSMDLEQMNFDFYARQLQGVQAMRPLEKRALGAVNNMLGEVLGKVYVKTYFPEDAKAKASEMIDYLKKSYTQHIQNLSWMSPETKIKALDKLNKIIIKIGYPDKWKDYSAMQIKSSTEGGSYYENRRNISTYYYWDNINKLGKPVDRTEWHMNPQTVNAYYNPANNEIVFPAAILQAPFYDYRADAAINFGGIGAVIGHEISHGFDDSGSDYDGDGNLVNWWRPIDAENFKKSGKELINQYNAYETLPGIFVNGQFTLGENIGDLGGINTAYTALQLYLKNHPNEQKSIDNFTPNQRFFLSWATIWRVKAKTEFLKNQVKVDPHSPGYFRAIGPLSNMDSFHNAFNVKEGDKMYKAPEKRIIIW